MKEVFMSKQFTDFKLQPYIIAALQAIHFKEATPIQERLIPVIASGKSVVGQSQTGSGKTHAFLVPIFNVLDPTNQDVQVVITTPSRELAEQIFQAAEQIAKFSPRPIRIHNYVGGTDKKRQIEKLHHQQPQIVIGTPGRIRDLIDNEALKSYTATTFVVDEADMTLDMGFLNDVDKIAATFPDNLQMLVFSATIPQKLQPFLKKYLNAPVIEEIPATTVISPTIDNWLVSTQGKSKNELIYHLLTAINPYLALVFANTKRNVDDIAAYLTKRGLKVAKISGDLSPRDRKKTMRQIQNLDFQYVVATDLASRGIDIPGISHVINAEIPDDLDFFIHRVGRTGRNGLSGIAMTLYEPGQENLVTEIEKLGIEFEPKQVKNGEIVDTYDRNRRAKREKTKPALDTRLVGLAKKEKKKHKPGYKKRIRKAIQKDEWFKRRVRHQKEARDERTKRRNEH
ncbi:DEAD/DEAH box helicase [Loigolactobacillus backii]|uniref:DEAD-box ATP-dependent RNA helicase CshB n=2 Tax=Loigolactobacillus backii TaxID=375175 RepID=A0A192H309_9LACO|nr:DEAD/DEAH box helicase [Loigolactobacillus backii]ANK59200.1 DEAD/DEAH box helicase [Loigolactobacillus backii]ANK62612.1 DEAD/DEAH box helicase [Loigolactobacillus backii]ANK64190.1 DEAD/DEAH box helicase [Loigolactobacillus backii]ANK67415.1 DEAD/DEAH box helicase [Loigolactobacillus backii]ANK70378.1 DEAD/DEAH box helicase [Loigolactobacillus backii]